ncbi:hypothetical protein K492DRAFT_151915 [Lichtheimia hyalospora FSU 10163]|nr:hypothetical protein K492DRAFT_151915 [Lichtheimia hyalospora FSU 10163]
MDPDISMDSDGTSCYSSPDNSSSSNSPSATTDNTTTTHHDNTTSPQQPESMKTKSTDTPVKVRKKPGRKPNPASPALRKAQNRAAQRAFRERKEKHLRELETTIKQVRNERDQLLGENDQLKNDNDILKCENWYLKGIVLSLQLVCLQHNLTIPQHGPHINDQTLSVLAQSIPEPISSYMDVNSKSQIPSFNKTASKQQRDRYVSSSTIVLTEEGAKSMASNQHHHQRRRSSTPANLPDLTPVDEPVHHNHPYASAAAQTQQPSSRPPSSSSPSTHVPRPVMLSDEALTSNLAAIQALRLRLRLQAACVRMSSLPFAIQPTLLQLTIPHDPRIDLIPTPSMRDRMILFRDQFSLDDCFRCLLSGSVFHGGDPAIAGNWQLPPEFFEKYWFLTIDFSLHRMTNQWRRMQGLQEVPTQPEKYTTFATASELSSFLGVDIPEFNKQPTSSSSPSDMEMDPSAMLEVVPPPPNMTSSSTTVTPSSYPASLASTASSKTTMNNEQVEMFSNTPIQLTNGYWRPKAAAASPPQHQLQHPPIFTRRWDTFVHDQISEIPPH